MPFRLISMKTFHLPILFALFTVLACEACKEPVELPTYYVDKAILRYAWFPDGSYWIYKERNSVDVFDSVYSLNARQGIDEVEGQNYQNETYGMTIIADGRYTHQVIFAIPTGTAEDPVLSELREIYSNASVEHNDYLLTFNPVGNETFGIFPFAVQTHHDSMEVEGTTYYDVYEVDVTPSSNADWTHHIVWAKDVGIIQRFTIDGKEWNLVRHHINR
jgi:hypothetical protein